MLGGSLISSPHFFNPDCLKELARMKINLKNGGGIYAMKNVVTDDALNTYDYFYLYSGE